MLKVLIQGPAGAGKTALAATLDKLLSDAGYAVSTRDEGIGQLAPPNNLYDYIPSTNDGRLISVEVKEGR